MVWRLQLEFSEQERKKLKLTVNSLVFTHSNKILLFTKSRKAYKCDIGTKQGAVIEGYRRQHKFTSYCIAKNVRFNDCQQMGFEQEDLSVFGNTMAFGVYQHGIGIFLADAEESFSFDGQIPFRSSYPVYSDEHGLLLIGGRQRANADTANTDVFSVEFDEEDEFSLQKVTELPYKTNRPSALTLLGADGERWFVCGGWWYGQNLKSTHLYMPHSDRWMQLKNMNHCHRSAGICEWKERGNKVIVAAGYGRIENHKVEEYDFEKDMWSNLPDLNEKHATYPLMLPSNGLLFCIGGVRGAEDEDMGCIELFDPRDRANKWIDVGTVEQYFGLPNDTGAGKNCFLPL